MRKYCFLIVLVVAVLAGVSTEALSQSDSLSHKKSYERAYERAYKNAQERYELAKVTPIPEYNYHVETAFSLSGAFKLNDFSPTGEPLVYSSYVPEYALRCLFLRSGKVRFGLEGSVSYAFVPQGRTRSVLYSVGLTNGVYKMLSEKFFFATHFSIGYISGMVDRSQPEALSSIAHGVYVSDRLSLFYKTDHSSAIGLTFSANAYHLWPWRHSSDASGNAPTGNKSGFGFYPSIGIAYYFGGL